MKTLRTTWRPLPHQEPVLANDTGIDFLIGGVGSGKTQTGSEKAFGWVSRMPRRRDGRPTQGLILGKDFRNAGGTQFLAIRERVRELGLPESAVIVEERGAPEPMMRFWNGVVVQAFTGTNPASTKSYEADWLWADEAEEMDALSAVTALGRLRSAEAMRAIFTSNPAGGGWIYPLLSGENPEWDEIRRVNDVRFFRWASSQNTRNDPKVMKSLRAVYRAVSPGLELQEMGGRFLGTAEAPGSAAIDFVKAFQGRVQLPGARDARASCVGADLGKTEDDCFFTAVNSSGVALAMDAFNIGDVDVSDADYWPYVAERLIAFAVQWGATLIVIDEARGGDQFAALLREEIKKRGLSIRVEGIRTDFGGKKTGIMQALGVAISMGRFVVPTAWQQGGQPVAVEHVEKLRMQFRKLKKIDMGGGRVKFDHEPGSHDDGPVSCGLAWHGIAPGYGRRASSTSSSAAAAADYLERGRQDPPTRDAGPGERRYRF